MVDRVELEIPLPDGQVVAFADLPEVRADLVLIELCADQGQRQPGADQRDVGALAQQVWQRTDVVLVPMRQDDGVDVVEAVAVVLPVRQREVDAG